MKRKFAGWGLAVMASVALTAGRANASVLFFDDFDANPVGLNATPAGWTVTTGTVDIVGTGLAANLCTDMGGSPSSSRCIDMDGSTNAAGTMQTNAMFNFVPGPLYTLSFYFSGNDRGGAPDTMTASAGSITFGLVVPSDAPWQLFFAGFTVAAPTSTPIVFSHQGNDNIGILIDNVTLSDDQQTRAVPEPMSLTLLGSGLIGAWFHRRRQNRTA
jgi:hypothetical protein